MQRTLSAFLIAAAASAALATSATPANSAAAKCGINKVDEGVYLTEITGRFGITCKGAQTVARAAMEKRGDSMLCAKKSKFNGWTVKHTGNEFAIQARFTKLGRRFTLASQGSC